MTDLEMTKLCAAAMKDFPHMVEIDGGLWFGYESCVGPKYDPLHDDAQAMALVKKCKLQIAYGDGRWAASHDGISFTDYHDDLNRAIVVCVSTLF